MTSMESISMKKGGRVTLSYAHFLMMCSKLNVSDQAAHSHCGVRELFVPPPTLRSQMLTRTRTTHQQNSE